MGLFGKKKQKEQKNSTIDIPLPPPKKPGSDDDLPSFPEEAAADELKLPEIPDFEMPEAKDEFSQPTSKGFMPPPPPPKPASGLNIPPPSAPKEENFAIPMPPKMEDTPKSAEPD